jgi:hypothetical protein
VAALLAVFVSAFGSSVLLSTKWREPLVSSSSTTPLLHSEDHPGAAHGRDNARGGRGGGRKGGGEGRREGGKEGGTEGRRGSDGAKGTLRSYNLYQDEQDSFLYSDSWHWQGGESANDGGEWGGSSGGVGDAGGGRRKAVEEVSDLEMALGALLGDEILAGLLPRQLDGGGAPLTAAKWASWCVTQYMDVLFAYRLLDVVALLRDIFPQPLQPGGGITDLSWVTLQYRNGNSVASECIPVRGLREGGHVVDARGQGALKCSVCRLPVFGLATTCSKCGHGGHVHHLKFWFSKYSICATGCGCQCHSE